jgi:glycosyltransferase involved in cell wall biosynthesis
MPSETLRVLIVAENASAKFGGEAALPVHYFRLLRQRGIETWLIAHERTRSELQALFPQDFERIYFEPDTALHRGLNHLGTLPPRGLMGAIFPSMLLGRLTQIWQRWLAVTVIREQKINLVHQPIPVSPKQISMLFGLGVPVIIGPMNGGMNYPPAFQHLQGRLAGVAIKLGRKFANLANLIFPGKRQAAVLLVANQRTREALPLGACPQVVEIVENGVDLSIWQPLEVRSAPTSTIPQFVFMGRLVDWKAVDLLLLAFKQVLDQVPARLEIIGDGVERQQLEQLAQNLGLPTTTGSSPENNGSSETSGVHFRGWLSQIDCARRLQELDVLILPSLYECGGAVVLEAMAMGMPVIATNWGGPMDYLDPSCGILVEPTSRTALIEGLAAAMLKLATNPDLRQVMGRAARERVVKEFNWDTKMDQILNIYLQAVGCNSHTLVPDDLAIANNNKGSSI